MCDFLWLHDLKFFFHIPQVAGAYPPYVPKNSAALLQTKMRKIAPVPQASDGAISEARRAASALQNSVRSDARLLDAKAPTSTAAGIIRPAGTCEGVSVIPGCTQFSRHKIYYNTKRENKFGMPASHILLQPESASSLSQMSMELFGGSPEMSESFMRNSLLIAFLRGLRKRFQRCTVLKILARGCPIGSRKHKNRKNSEVEVIDSYRGGSSSDAPKQCDKHPMEIDLPQKSRAFTENGYEGSAGCKATAVLCKAEEGEHVMRDVGMKKEEVHFKKTKRGCRGGKRKLEIRSASPTSSNKRRKNEGGCAVDSIDQTATSHLLSATTATKQSTNGQYGVTGYPIGLCHNHSTACTYRDLTYGPVPRVSSTTTNRPDNCPGPYPAQGPSHRPSSYPPPPKSALASQKTVQPVNAPRTGTVGDRLLARMRSNVFKDITLTRSRKEPGTAGPSSADCSPPGGYISQDDCVRRSRRASRGMVLSNSALQSEAQGGGGGGGGGGGVTNKRQCDMEREAKAPTEWSQSDRRKSFSLDTSVNDFQYWVESSEGTGGKDEGDGEGEGDCAKNVLNVSDTAESRLPVNTVISNYINPTLDNLYDHSASDNNCTDVTESVSSLLVSQGIKATTARALDSGLALHVTYRTLRTEVVKYFKYKSTFLLECDM
jgi:hypothetical protein